MPGREKLCEFAAWFQSHITGDQKGQAQTFLNRLFQVCEGSQARMKFCYGASESIVTKQLWKIVPDRTLKKQIHINNQ